MKLQNRTLSLLHPWTFFHFDLWSRFRFCSIYQIISAMCCSKFFLSLARSHRRLIRKFAILCGLWNKNCLRRLLFQPPIGYIFLTFLFFVPSLKRRLILLFVSVFSLCIICLFQCSAVITLVRFLVISFFCIFTDSSFRLRSIVPIVRCLGGGYCGNTVNSVFCNYFFFGNTFFFL